MSTAPPDAPIATFVELPIAQLIESPHNYRKTTDKEADLQLAASVVSQGVLQPLLVRPIEGKRGRYEVVFGNRRLRAAREAKLESVPCQVRQLTDLQALEAALVENVQRADVHPVEEADGFRELHLSHGYSVAEIAAKTGRSEGWVRARLKLAELDQAGRRACLDGKLSPGVALLVARVVAKPLQAKVVRELVEWGRGRELSYADARRQVLNASKELSEAPWKLDDAELVPEAGACSVCPKRTKNDAALFKDLERADVCMDSACFKAKLDAHWKAIAGKAQERGARVLTDAESKKVLGRGYVQSSSGFAEADGHATWNAGRQQTWAQVAKKAGADLVVARGSDGRPVQLVELTPAVRKAAKLPAPAKVRGAKRSPENAYERKRKRQNAALRVAGLRIAERIERNDEGLAGLPDAARRVIGRALLGEFWDDLKKKVAERRGIEGKRNALETWAEGATPAQVDGVLVELLLHRAAINQQGGQLKQLLGIFGLELGALAREADKAQRKEAAERTKSRAASKKKPATAKTKAK